MSGYRRYFDLGTVAGEFTTASVAEAEAAGWVDSEDDEGWPDSTCGVDSEIACCRFFFPPKRAPRRR